MKKLAAAVLVFALAGCAELKAVSESEATFIACKSADVITTAVGLNSGRFVEANPLLKFVIGPHNIFPLIGFSIAMWALIHYVNSPKVNMAVNGITCGVAAHNAFVLHGAGVMH
jgi:hypothetical protein